MAFPLVLLPKRVMYVEDAVSFLEVLRLTMSNKHSREFVDSAHIALMTFAKEVAYWAGISEVLNKSHLARIEGKGEAAHYISSYFSDWRRFHLTGVLIVDFDMPGMDGLELIQKIKALPVRRVLLTGQADAAVAVKAFNAGLIQQFIPKNAPELFDDIALCCESMHESMSENVGHLIRPTLTTEQIDLLNDSSVAYGLKKKIEALDWAEYVTVGEPFGLLGMALDGPLQWLQIETPESITHLVEVGVSYGYPEGDIEAIRSGSSIAHWEILLRLGLQTDGKLVATEKICESPPVLVGVTDIPLAVLTGNAHGIDDIHSPAELVRSLVRDVREELNRIGSGAVEQPGSIDGQESLQKSLLHLADAIRLSEDHRIEFDCCFAELATDDPARGEIGRLHAALG
ncbi:MAG: response regulator [Caldisericota bacterium]|nr:response regulator [Caldisericota bacterium]